MPTLKYCSNENCQKVVVLLKRTKKFSIYNFLRKLFHIFGLERIFYTKRLSQCT
jgi:hypothetical protein